MALTYLVRNGTGLVKRFSLLDKQAYVFGGPVRLGERPNNGPRSAFLAVDEQTESTFISSLLSGSTDSIAASGQESSSKTPWPIPATSGKAPSANVSGVTTKADAESSLAGASSNGTTYRRIAIDDQSNPPTSITVDLTDKGAFIFLGVIDLPAGSSLALVAHDDEASNVAGWASSSGLTFTRLFDGSGGSTEPNFPTPAFDLSQEPFSRSGVPPLVPPRLKVRRTG